MKIPHDGGSAWGVGFDGRCWDSASIESIKVLEAPFRLILLYLVDQHSAGGWGSSVSKSLWLG